MNSFNLKLTVIYWFIISYLDGKRHESRRGLSYFWECKCWHYKFWLRRWILKLRILFCYEWCAYFKINVAVHTHLIYKQRGNSEISWWKPTAEQNFSDYPKCSLLFLLVQFSHRVVQRPGNVCVGRGRGSWSKTPLIRNLGSRWAGGN